WNQLPAENRPQLSAILQQQEERDQRDREREVGRLVAADDARQFPTDGLSLEQVVDRLVEWVEDRQ
ncbi:MAG: (d)CMP kinase, partial [Planctomycetota bacterium]|nr:(d)CMP kinase [Planctomycetota bacterium]